MNRNNKGFSLVELIVVIAIMLVITTGAVVVFSNTSTQKVKTGTDMIASYLQSVMNINMTKKDAYMEIYYDGKNYYVKDNDGNSEKLKNGVEVTYDIEDGASDNQITKAQSLIISYSRSNGAFRPIITSVKEDGTYVYLTKTDQGGNEIQQYVRNINIKSGSSAKTIRCYSKTGKSEIINE